MTVIKPQSPFERLKYANISGEVALKKAIILQAIIDASSIADSKEASKIEQEAKTWLFGDSLGFRRTCYEAELQPEYVIKISRSLIKLHHHRQLAKASQPKAHAKETQAISKKTKYVRYSH